MVLSDLRYKVDNADYKAWRSRARCSGTTTVLRRRTLDPKDCSQPREDGEPVDVQQLLQLAKDLPDLQRTSRETRKEMQELYPDLHFRVQEWELMFHATGKR